MRLRGESLEKISQHINGLGYFRLVKTSGRHVKMDKRRLSEVFRDSFYYGMLVQGTQIIDLRTKYEFQPSVSEEDFLTINHQGKSRLTPINTNRNTFYPFKAFVKCSFCDANMTVGPSTGGSGKRYFNFRCENPNCVRNSQENRDKAWNDPTKIKALVRVNILLNWLYDFLADGLNLTEEDYQIYLKEMTDVLTAKRTKFERELNSKQGTLKSLETELRDIALGVLKQKEGSTAKRYGE